MRNELVKQASSLLRAAASAVRTLRKVAAVSKVVSPVINIAKLRGLLRGSK